MSKKKDDLSSSALWELCAKLAEKAADLEAFELEARKPNEPESLDGRSPVIRFSKTFHAGAKRYEYAAIGIHGRWFLTGQNTDFFRWEELMGWIGEDNWETVEVLHGLVELKPGEEI